MTYWIEYRKGRVAGKRIPSATIYNARRTAIKHIGSNPNIVAYVYRSEKGNVPIGMLYYLKKDEYGNIWEEHIWEVYNPKRKGFSEGYHHAWKDGGISEKLEW